MKIIDGFLRLIDGYEGLIVGLGALSALTFIASILLIPWLIIQLPTDYFTDPSRHVSRMHQQHPLRYFAIRVLKNLLASALILAGIAMLVLPGQGLLSILIGLSISDFPGKYRVERWLVARPGIFKAINWIRKRYKKPPICYPIHL